MTLTVAQRDNEKLQKGERRGGGWGRAWRGWGLGENDSKKVLKNKQTNKKMVERKQSGKLSVAQSLAFRIQ